MNKIVEKEYFSERVVKLVVEAPLIARSRRPGHFVIVRCGDKGERIPLTIADADVKGGAITLVVQAVGASTEAICALSPGDCLTDVAGPSDAPPTCRDAAQSSAVAAAWASLPSSRSSGP